MHLVTDVGKWVDRMVGLCRHSSDYLGSSEIEENFEEVLKGCRKIKGNEIHIGQ